MRQLTRLTQPTTTRDERSLPATAPAAGDAALLAENVALRAENEQLGQAMATRAVIDQARGMVMALAPCSADRAWDLLVGVSQHCNIKLRVVAEALVATTRDEPLPAPIGRELRLALRRLHATDGT
ncbi:ANTAR domain-containing protein [Streptomyces sp. NPDC088350]|uniref:ANTAR domain-containing protein n=1 Tax=Streptomyces sp. NPDC088350 TaxID=3365854 RepID=UPI00380E18D6